MIQTDEELLPAATGMPSDKILPDAVEIPVQLSRLFPLVALDPLL